MVNYDGVTRTFNAANQMTNDGTNTLTYDNNGNLTGNGSDSYTWDRANRLLSVGNHSYVYNGLGNRVQQTVSSVVTDYLNDLQPSLTKLLKQDDGTNVEHFIHGVRGIHAVDNGTDWNFYAQDGLGSVRALMDYAGVVQSSMSYDPYGMPLGTNPDNFGFTGEQTDASGQVFLRARYYEPQLGIFSALDPWEGISNRPMSLNGYSWVEGNVPNATDPSGMMPLGFSRESKGYGFRLNVKWNPIYWNLQNPLIINRMNNGMCDGGSKAGLRVGNVSKPDLRFYSRGGSDIRQGDNNVSNQRLFDPQRYIENCQVNTNSHACDRFTSEVDCIIRGFWEDVENTWWMQGLSPDIYPNFYLSILAEYFAGVFWTRTVSGIEIWDFGRWAVQEGHGERYPVPTPPEPQSGAYTGNNAWRNPAFDSQNTNSPDVFNAIELSGFKRPYWGNVHHIMAYLKFIELYGAPFALWFNKIREINDLNDPYNDWQNNIGLPDEAAFEARYAWYYQEAVNDLYITDRIAQIRQQGSGNSLHLAERLGSEMCNSGSNSTERVTSSWSLENAVNEYYFDFPSQYLPPSQYHPR